MNPAVGKGAPIWAQTLRGEDTTRANNPDLISSNIRQTPYNSSSYQLPRIYLRTAKRLSVIEISRLERCDQDQTDGQGKLKDMPNTLNMTSEHLYLIFDQLCNQACVHLFNRVRTNRMNCSVLVQCPPWSVVTKCAHLPSRGNLLPEVHASIER